jgi:hypothetical protein
MKNYISTTDLAIWVVLIVFQVTLCFSILKRRLIRRLPWFAGYAFASTAQNLLLVGLAFLGSYAAYYYVFHITSHLISGLALLTLVEFGRQVLPGLDLPQKEKAFAWLLGAIGIIIGFASIWPLRLVADRLEVAGFLSISVSFIFIAGYASYLRLGWSRLLGGVSFTLGLLYLVNGATIAVMEHTSSLAVFVRANQAAQIANVIADAVWTIVVLSPWGEYKMTEDDLLKFQEIVGAAQANVRRFIAGGSQ